jgi:hypothetical protein
MEWKLERYLADSADGCTIEPDRDWQSQRPPLRTGFIFRAARQLQEKARQTDAVLSEHVVTPSAAGAVMWHVLMMVWVLLSAVQVPFRLAFNEQADFPAIEWYVCSLRILIDDVLSLQRAG